MKVYADTSFIVKLLTEETGSNEARAELRRVGFPRLPFLPLHALEVETAIRQKAFHSRHTIKNGERGGILRVRDAALGRMNQWLNRGLLLDTRSDWDDAMESATALSRVHTERLGCRGYDLVHVAFAVLLEAKQFLTTDRIQAQVAKAAGLSVITVD